MRFGDAGSMGHPAPAGHENRVMHAVVRIGEGVIMVMDSPPGMPVVTESKVQILLDFDDVAT